MIMAITLSVALILSIQLFTDSIKKAIYTDDFPIEIYSESNRFFSMDIIDTIANYENIEKIYPYLHFYPIKCITADKLDKNISLLGITPKYHYPKNILEGDIIESESDSSTIILNFRIMDELKLTIGDTILLSYQSISDSSDTIPTHYQKYFHIIGISEYRNMILLSSFQKFIQQSNVISHISIQAPYAYNDYPTYIQLSMRLGKDFYISDTRRFTHSVALDTFWEITEWVLPLISILTLLVAGFLLFNTFSITLAERIHIYGILHALGTTQKQLFYLIISESLLLGIIGSLLGLPVGIGIAKLALYIIKSFTGFGYPLHIPPINLLLSFFIGLIITLLSTIKPILHIFSLTPLAAITYIRQKYQFTFWKGRLYIGIILLIISFLLMYLPINKEIQLISYIIGLASAFIGILFLLPLFVKRLILILGKILKLIVGPIGHLTLSNMSWDPRKIVITIASILATITTIIIFKEVELTEKRAIEEYYKMASIDLIVFNSEPSILDSLENDINVEKMYKTGVREAFYNKQNPIILFYINPSDYTSDYNRTLNFGFVEENPDSAFAELEKGGRVFISHIFARRQNLIIGDTLNILVPPNIGKPVLNPLMLFFNRNVPLIIAGIIYTPLPDQIIVSFADTVLIGSPRGYQAFIKVNDDIDKSVDELKENFPSLHFANTEYMKEMFQKIIGYIMNLFSATIIVVCIISILGIINTLLLVILERTREIGILRALGTTRGQIRLMTLIEAIIIGLCGAILGEILGLYAYIAAMRNLEYMTGVKVDLIFPLEALLWGLGLALLMSIISSIYPAERAARIVIVKAINYE